MPPADVVAGELARPDLDPDPDALLFGDPTTRVPRGHRRMYERLPEAPPAAGLDAPFGFHSLRHS